MKFWHLKFPDQIFNIQYNKLVNNPKEEIQKLLYYLDLSWDENCLNHHENKRSIKTASSTQARKPIYKSALNSSKNFIEFFKDL